MNSDGSTYPVGSESTARGSGAEGIRPSSRFKIFVVGDSYTQAVEVSDWACLPRPAPRDAGDAEIFAYGAGGYATLQEFMILDRYVELNPPDSGALGIPPNDFVDNVPDLEAASLYSNNGLRRPYLVDGRADYLVPRPDPLGARTFAQWHSRLAAWALARWGLLRPALAGEVGPAARSEHAIDEQGARHTVFARAAAGDRRAGRAREAARRLRPHRRLRLPRDAAVP